jgi:molybdopterin-guanine dinucleotide biosynthesis protein A
MRTGVTGAVLAGGASRRMGRDKRLLHVDGVPMARRAADALYGVCDELLIVVSARMPLDPNLFAGLRWRSTRDRRADAGPLAGLEAGLVEARHDLVLVVGADAPWLSPSLLRHLARRLAASDQTTDAVAVGGERGPEPLLACYRRRVLATVTDLLDRGERRAGALLDTCTVEIVPPEEWRRFDPAGASLRNVNRPADLERSA